MTRLLARPALLFACATAAPVAARAQAAAPASQPAAKLPNLSGTWELNVAKSDFGLQAGVKKGTMTVMQTGDKITRTQMMSSVMGDNTNTTHHTIGAATTDTMVMGGQAMPFTSTARWDGTTLVVDGSASVQGMAIPVVARYTLSADGKQLMVDQVITSPMGEQTTHAVYDKKG